MVSFYVINKYEEKIWTSPAGAKSTTTHNSNIHPSFQVEQSPVLFAQELGFQWSSWAQTFISLGLSACLALGQEAETIGAPAYLVKFQLVRMLTSWFQVNWIKVMFDCFLLVEILIKVKVIASLQYSDDYNASVAHGIAVVLF